MNDPEGRARFIAACPDVSPSALARLDRYADLLREWTTRINLISPSTREDIWIRHFLDSAQLLPLIPPGGGRRVVDLGSGAGFPGLVLALLGEMKAVHLVESDRRKVVFMQEVSRVAGLHTTVFHVSRIEEVDPLGADVVTARALAPLDKLLPLAARHVKPGGVCLFLKGGDHENEIALARRTCSFKADVLSSLTSPDGVVLRLTDLTVEK